MWQPFASLLAAGIKQVDSRGFNTNFRGEFFIHASQSIPRQVYDDYYLGKILFRQIVNEFLHVSKNSTLSILDFRQGFTLGAIVGKGTLLYSSPSSEVKRAHELKAMSKRWEIEEALGDHGPGRWAWEVLDPELLPPQPIKGRQQIFWKIPDNFLI